MPLVRHRKLVRTDQGLIHLEAPWLLAGVMPWLRLETTNAVCTLPVKALCGLATVVLQSDVACRSQHTSEQSSPATTQGNQSTTAVTDQLLLQCTQQQRINKPFCQSKPDQRLLGSEV